MSYSWNYDYPQIARDSGFKLRQFEEGSVNWRAVGSVEVGRIVTEQNLEQVDCLLEYISEAPLVPILKSNVLESGLCKFFGLAQLGIQYLLFCKKFLDKTVAGMREALRENQAENYKLKSQNDEINNEFLRLHQKLERLEEINKVLYPCPTCPKNFVSSDMLKTHIARKHSQSQNKLAEASDRSLINTIKLELEIKQLKERLNAAEKQIQQGSVPAKEEPVLVSTSKAVVEANEVKSTSVQTELIANDIGIQTNLSDDKDLDEVLDGEVRRNEELLQEIRSKFSDIEKWKAQETEFSQKFMEAVMEKLKTLKTAGGNVSIDDIQPVVAKAIGNFDIAYMDKLNGIADKIEGSLKETFSDLHDELKQLSKTQEEVQSTMGTLLKERNPHSPGNSVKEIAQQKGFQEVPNPLCYSEHVELVEDKNELLLPARHSVSIKDTSTEKKSCVDDFEPDVPMMSSLVAKSVGKVVPEQRTVQQKRTKDHKRYPKEEIKDINVSAQLNEKLADLGISPKANSLPDNVASRALELLAKRHKLKETPNFFRVRSKIEKVVDKLSRERASNEVDHTSEAPTTSDFPSREKRQVSGSPENLDDFKLRLEKILNAPIEKVPKPPYSVPVASKPMYLQGDSVQKKPVPVPRKRVMFDLERTGMQSPPL